ncbi:lysylphosphatidylglycerol synthase transmembrane domain-containing protein [Bacillus sp. REN10]|uniref:lysylphosphatidylglycerol synthase transmembrane domain-containing protein n=1 Tax=Bacillus sp. REN10 TaxID=2782541 RepID=UPI00193C7C20|nr:lysylphosphatidylglycerol synthase transmembrane domain-containing protein [Bacillus sp. REN10]
MTTKHIYKGIKRGISVLILALFFWLLYRYIDSSMLMSSLQTVKQHPWLLVGGLAVYGLSFAVKALAWTWYLRGRIRFSTALIGILYSLFVNHLLPVKAGELFRAYICKEREGQAYFMALQSVAVMRGFDFFILIAIAYIGLYWLPFPTSFPLYFIAILTFIGGLLLIGMIRWKKELFLRQWVFFKDTFWRSSTIPVFGLVLLSWLMEAALVWTVASALVHPVTSFQAIWINSMTVAGQTFQITPGGIANYETVMSLAFRAVGDTVEFGMTVALITHGLKFIFSFGAGAVVWLIHPLSFKNVLYTKKKGGIRQ